MATVPPKLPLEAHNRVVRDGHCPYLAEEQYRRLQLAPGQSTYEQMLIFIANDDRLR